MTETSKRYFDLKADVNRVEVSLQESDRPLVVTGPVAVDESDGSKLYALESSPGVKEITRDDYTTATKATKAASTAKTKEA